MSGRELVSVIYAYEVNFLPPRARTKIERSYVKDEFIGEIPSFTSEEAPVSFRTKEDVWTRDAENKTIEISDYRTIGQQHYRRYKKYGDMRSGRELESFDELKATWKTTGMQYNYYLKDAKSNEDFLLDCKLVSSTKTDAQRKISAELSEFAVIDGEIWVKAPEPILVITTDWYRNRHATFLMMKDSSEFNVKDLNPNKHFPLFDIPRCMDEMLERGKYLNENGAESGNYTYTVGEKSENNWQTKEDVKRAILNNVDVLDSSKLYFRYDPVPVLVGAIERKANYLYNKLKDSFLNLPVDVFVSFKELYPLLVSVNVENHIEVRNSIENFISIVESHPDFEFDLKEWKEMIQLYDLCSVDREFSMIDEGSSFKI